MENIKDNKVCILTSFYNYDTSYSIIAVVESQIKMLINNGYKIKLIVEEGFSEESATELWRNENVTIERIPAFNRDNDGNMSDNYQENVDKLYNSLKEKLQDCKVVLTHDLILQPAEIELNLAVRRIAQENKEILFLHMAHSSTAPEIRCSNPDIRAIIQQPWPSDAFVIYPNDSDRKRVALNYKYEMDRVKCTHHPIDIPEFFGFHKLSKELVKEKDLLTPDFMAVYPIRLDRGKQVEWVIRIMAALKRLGRSVRLVVMDFSSTGGDKCVYRDELKNIAREEGLVDNEITFMSEWRENTHYSSPRQMVKDLMMISNLYVHPSTSETYSLTTQEAIMCKNFVILNAHTPYMKEIYGDKNILFEGMSSAINCLTMEDGSTDVTINDIKLHFENIARKVIYFIDNNPVLDEQRFIRQHRNLDYVFKRELEPLFYKTNLK